MLRRGRKRRLPCCGLDPSSLARHPSTSPPPAPAVRLAPVQVQRCTLLSIKTGGCPENCGYCSQSSSWSKETGTKAEKLMGLEEVYEVRRGRTACRTACHTACRPRCGRHGEWCSLSCSHVGPCFSSLPPAPPIWPALPCARRRPCAPRPLAAPGSAWAPPGAAPPRSARASGSVCWRWSGEQAGQLRPVAPTPCHTACPHPAPCFWLAGPHACLSDLHPADASTHDQTLPAGASAAWAWRCAPRWAC